MSAAQSNAIKVIALSAASIALLSACGEPKATPMDDEYAGNSGESVQSQEEKSKTDGKASGDTADDGDATKNRADANSATSDKQDTGNYADGDYSINGQYGAQQYMRAIDAGNRRDYGAGAGGYDQFVESEGLLGRRVAVFQ